MTLEEKVGQMTQLTISMISKGQDQNIQIDPDKLEKAIAVTIPYSVGIAVPKDKPKFREAVMAVMMEIYKSGDQAALLKKWELDPNNLKEPGLLTVN